MSLRLLGRSRKGASRSVAALKLQNDYSAPAAYGFRDVLVKGFVDEVVEDFSAIRPHDGLNMMDYEKIGEIRVAKIRAGVPVSRLTRPS
jgi:hypothetical protein